MERGKKIMFRFTLLSEVKPVHDFPLFTHWRSQNNMKWNSITYPPLKISIEPFFKEKRSSLIFSGNISQGPSPSLRREGRPYRPKTRIQRRVSKDTHPTAGAVPRAGPKGMFDRLLWHADYAETQIHSVSAESARSAWRIAKTPVTVTYWASSVTLW